MNREQAIAWLALEGYEAWRPVDASPVWEGVSKGGALTYRIGRDVVTIWSGWPTIADKSSAFIGLDIPLNKLHLPELLVKELLR